MAEISEEKQQKAREKELRIAKKLEDASKRQMEMVKFQKTQTIERLQKWQERRAQKNHSAVVEDRKRLNLSNKFTRDQSDEIMRRRTMQA